MSVSSLVLRGTLRLFTYPLHELLAVLVNNALRELDLAKADVLVHLLRVLGVEWTPATTHLEQKNPKTPEINEFGISMLVKQYLWR